MTKSVGVIGLGRMGYRTVLAAREAGLDVTGLLDLNPQPWALEQEPGLAEITTHDPEKFWANPPEIITITTTATSHLPIMKTALENGVRRILMEKPLACSLQEAREAGELAEKYNARVVVNHSKRYSPMFQKMLNLSRSHEMGTLRSIYIAMGCSGHGCVGTHYFDLMNWLFQAMPVKVTAIETIPDDPNPRGAELDDRGGAVLLEYPGKRRGLLELGDDIGVIGGMEFRYEYGFIGLENEGKPPRHFQRLAEVREKSKSHYGAPLEELEWGPFEVFDAVKATKHALLDVMADTPVVVGLKQGIEAMEVFSAIRKSGADNVSVSLPLSGDAVTHYYPIP